MPFCVQSATVPECWLLTGALPVGCSYCWPIVGQSHGLIVTTATYRCVLWRRWLYSVASSCPSCNGRLVAHRPTGCILWLPAAPPVMILNSNDYMMTISDFSIICLLSKWEESLFFLKHYKIEMGPNRNYWRSLWDCSDPDSGTWWSPDSIFSNIHSMDCMAFTSDTSDT